MVHKNMGMPGRKIITIPNWLLNLGIKAMEKNLRDGGDSSHESGIYLPKFSDIQSADTYIDRLHGCNELGVEDDNIEKAIGESIRLAVDVLDGNVKNVIGMKGE